jgi:cytochrome c
MRYVYVVLLIGLLTGCENGKPKTVYDGESLLKEKCAMCHNLDMPPKTYEDEKAPPMMAVAFHLKDFMHIETHSDAVNKFIPFVQDYVLHPSREKSYCDKESLESYGVMPSQQGNVTEEELEAIAEYMVTFYDQQKYLKEMQAKAAFEALPKGEQLVVRSGCYNCHDTFKDKVGPSFQHIAQSPKRDIVSVIENGSKGKWEAFSAMMPSFKGKFSKEELQTLKTWIEGFAAKETPKTWRAKNGI